jgi:hypothetical protein
MPKRTSRQQRMRLADPTTVTAMDGAMAEAKARFDRQLRILLAEMALLVTVQRVGALSSADQVRLMALRAEFDALAIQQKYFAVDRSGPSAASCLVTLF